MLGSAHKSRILLLYLCFKHLSSEYVELNDIFNPSPADVYLSIVVVGRNDDWGGVRFVHKLQLFINFTTVLACEVSKVSAELVLVDWNPPENEHTLIKLLSWPRFRRTACFCFSDICSPIFVRGFPSFVICFHASSCILSTLSMLGDSVCLDKSD